MMSKEMMIAIALGLLLALSAAVVGPKISAQMLITRGNLSMDFIGTLRTVAQQFIPVGGTGDFQNISMEKLVEKNLLSSSTFPVSGSGGGSYVPATFDKKIFFSISDPTGSGTSVKITADASGKYTDAKDLQTYEDLLQLSINSSGGTVVGYESSGADGVISAIYE